MSKVVSIFRSLLNKQDEHHPLPPIPDEPIYQENGSEIFAPNLTGFKVDTLIGRVTLQKCDEPTITPGGSIYSPRTAFCGLNAAKVPVTAGKPYRVLATYVGVRKRNLKIYFFQFQCDDGSIHLVNPSDCEFLGCELKAA